MALASNETWRSGFVVLLDDEGNPSRISITFETDTARWWSGFLRDVDGRLVVTYG